MKLGTKSKLLSVLVLVGVSMLSGCMFYAKFPDGDVEQVMVSSQEIFRFMKAFDDISGEMIREANFRGDRVLSTAITQMRQFAYDLRKRSFNSQQAAVDLALLERKFTAFDTQIRNRVHEFPNAPGAQAIYSFHYKLKNEVMRFKKLIENSVH